MAQRRSVQLAFGHSTPIITLNSYTHEWPDALAWTRTLVDAALGSYPSTAAAGPNQWRRACRGELSGSRHDSAPGSYTIFCAWQLLQLLAWALIAPTADWVRLAVPCGTSSRLVGRGPYLDIRAPVVGLWECSVTTRSSGCHA